jgi:hypothetical protein
MVYPFVDGLAPGTDAHKTLFEGTLSGGSLWASQMERQHAVNLSFGGEPVLALVVSAPACLGSEIGPLFDHFLAIFATAQRVIESWGL